MIPPSLLSKMGKYEIEIGGVKVETKVAEQACDIDSFLSKLRERPQTKSSTSPIYVLGMDVKFDQFSCSKPKLLLLCNGSVCLIINLTSCCPSYLKKSIFQDETTLLVGLNSGPFYEENIGSVGGVGLGHFGARVFQQPEIEKYGLDQLGTLVGVDVKPGKKLQFSRGETLFSKEKIKDAMHDVYYSYVIAKKLCDFL